MNESSTTRSSQSSRFKGRTPKLAVVIAVVVVASLADAISLAAEREKPLALHPDNPHYFLFRGKPTIIITSAEHYGAVLNLDFDYVKYLDELAAHGLNNTRTFRGRLRRRRQGRSTSPRTRWPRSRTASSARGRAATRRATPTAATSST